MRPRYALRVPIAAILASLACALAAAPASAAYKVRLDYVRANACAMPGVFYGTENVSGAGSTPVLSQGVTNMTLGGSPAPSQVRVTVIAGALVMTLPAASPTGGETNGIRLQVGDERCVPINNGQVIAFTEAQDAPAGAPVAQVTWPSADASSTITTGGAAQVLFGGAVPANGFKIAIPSSANTGVPCWLSDTTTTPSATTAGSYAVFPQGQWSTEPSEKPAGPVYLNCPTTGQVFSAKRW